MRIRDDFDACNRGCAIGAITSSYFGWNGKGDCEAAGEFRNTSNTLKQAAVIEDFIIELSDSGENLDEIAFHLLVSRKYISYMRASKFA
jgi:hypothetical protein